MGTLRTGDGRTLAYREEGRGPFLVCHPGGPGFSSLYLQDLAALGEHFSLIKLDPRGTGGSDRPADPRAYTIEDHVGDVEALRTHLGVQRMHLLGHSFGGVVAMAYAAAHPERLDRLVLASSLARFSAEQAQAAETAMKAHSGEPWYADARAALEEEESGRFHGDEELSAIAMRELPLYFARYGAAAAAYLKIVAREHINSDALGLFNREIMTTFDLRPELPRITAPTLVITGEADFITSPVCAEEIAACIAGVRKVIIPDAGHFTFIEAPAAFRAELLSFLSSQVKGRSTEHGQGPTQSALGPGMATETGDAIENPALLEGQVITATGTPESALEPARPGEADASASPEEEQPKTPKAAS